MRVVPTGRFRVEEDRGRLLFYPESLQEEGIYFVAEERNGLYLVHDDGTTLEVLSERVGDAVDVVREVRFGCRCHGFGFREGVVSVKVPRGSLEDTLRRMERFVVEVYHKTTKGLGE